MPHALAALIAEQVLIVPIIANYVSPVLLAPQQSQHLLAMMHSTDVGAFEPLVRWLTPAEYVASCCFTLVKN